MPITVKSLEEIKKNYKGSTGEAARRYKESIPRIGDIVGASIAAQPRYVEQMSNPEVLDRRVAGLRKVSNESIKAKMATIGAQRIKQGMDGAVEKQARGYAPYRELVSGLDLPDKTTDVDANIERVRIVAKAQHELRKQLLRS